MIDPSVEREYGNRLRIRAAGICIRNNKILLVNHSGLNEENEFWAPPGGGLQYEETVKSCLEREFFEETGLKIQAGDLLCITEYMKPPLHAIELFFEVRFLGGSLQSGSDPEVVENEQIIQKVEFLEFSQLEAIPASMKHQLLRNVKSTEDLMQKKGYFHFPEAL